jgi:hypothetical protein
MASTERESIIPTDLFSRTQRQLRDNPGALSSASTINATDFYGNTETWVVETFRQEDGRELVFIQRNSSTGGERWVLPVEVTAALARHRDQLAARVRRRAGHRLVAQRKERGDVLGNPEALRLARGRQKARKAGRQ